MPEEVLSPNEQLFKAEEGSLAEMVISSTEERNLQNQAFLP